MQQTLLMIKPDAVSRNLVGEILHRVERDGLSIRRLRMLRLTVDQARDFYKVHEGKAFFAPLVAFMASGPVVVAVLEGEDAIERLDGVVGPTDPAQAPVGTIRRDFGLDVRKNAVHRSDAPETAQVEIGWFQARASL